MESKHKKEKTEVLSEHGIVEFRLDSNMERFLEIEADFIKEVANILKADPENIKIVNMRESCVIVVIDMPQDKKQELEELLSLSELPKEIKDFCYKYKINPSKIRMETILEAPYIKLHLKDLLEPGRTLTWVHISDLHLRIDREAKKWQQDVVTDEFLRDLPGLLNEFKLIPDFIFLTGDLSHSGKKKEFKAVEEFLNQLSKIFTEIPQIFFVPGNHDVMWKDIDPDVEKGLRERLRDFSSVDEHLLDSNKKAERVSGFLRLSKFFKFTGNFPLSGQSSMDYRNYFYAKIVKHQNLNLGIAGLNSAWRSANKEKVRKGQQNPDKYNLILGDHQVIESIKKLDKAHIKLALIHHPPISEWFKDFDRNMQEERMSGFDFVLRGHEHRISAQFNKLLGLNKEWFHIASSALYSRPSFPNSFNAVRINLDRGKGIIFYWQYVKRAHWRKDFTFAPDGFSHFELPEGLYNRILSA